jgi:hypothetical protein
MKLVSKILSVFLLSIGLLMIETAMLFGHRDKALDDLKAKYAPPPSAFVSGDGMDVHYRDEGD